MEKHTNTQTENAKTRNSLLAPPSFGDHERFMALQIEKKTKSFSFFFSKRAAEHAPALGAVSNKQKFVPALTSRQHVILAPRRSSADTISSSPAPGS